MKKIIVFYDSDDLEIARKIGREIDAIGFTSWLADDNNKRDWHAEVEELVPSENCAGAVVIWSKNSKSNPVVRDEAKEIIKVKKPLLSLLLNGITEAPIGLRDGPRHPFEYQPEDNIYEQVALKIRAVFGNGGRQERALILNGKRLPAPSMILSVSSFETQLEPDAALSLLSHVSPPAVLVSAYDLLRPEPMPGPPTIEPKITNIAAIDRMRKSDSLVLLDSGNYEAMRYKDTDWKENKQRLLQALELIDVDLAFTHDSFPQEISPVEVCARRRIDEVSEEYGRDQSLVNCAVAPIIHAPRFLDGQYCFDLLPEICCGVVSAVAPPMIAVAERELGDGIMERICTVAKIRNALDAQGSATLLHILGTGNPITMAFLSMAGADFFDGLEWCRTAIDGKSWRLYHFQQWDFFAEQTGEIASDEIAGIIRSQSDSMPWFIKVAVHNMAFFMQASKEIQAHHSKDSYDDLFQDKGLWVQYKLANARLEGLS